MVRKRHKITIKPPSHAVKNESHDTKKPIFSFHHMVKDYCISCCNKDEQAALSQTLRKLSNFTWLGLKNKPKHGLGYEKIARTSIKGSIPIVITDEVNILAFRFCRMKPMVGYRVNDVFHVVWLDREFKLYKH